MEEIEVPLEKAQEEIHEHAMHSGGWISRVALSSALFAVVAAIAALLAGHHSNEAMIDQIRAANFWSYYQSKSIKNSLLNSKVDILLAQGKHASEKDEEKLKEYKKEMEEITREAKEREEASEKHLHLHETLAKAVTLIQIGIAISAIAVLVRKKRFWYVSLGFGCIGIYFFIIGLLH